jgi:hypothetical protein
LFDSKEEKGEYLDFGKCFLRKDLEILEIERKWMVLETFGFSLDCLIPKKKKG